MFIGFVNERNGMRREGVIEGLKSFFFRSKRGIGLRGWEVVIRDDLLGFKILDYSFRG